MAVRPGVLAAKGRGQERITGPLCAFDCGRRVCVCVYARVRVCTPPCLYACAFSVCVCAEALGCG